MSDRKKINKKKRGDNGNGRNNFLRVLYWNSGNSYLKNQMNEVKLLVHDKQPHILFVAESNLWRDHDKSLV